MREDTILPYNDNGERQTKRREQAPALRCTDIFLCIYRKFRICLTNASGDTQVLITFTGGQFRKMMRTQYLMEFLSQENHTLIVLRFQKELFGLPPMTPSSDIDLCMKQKLNAVRKK